MSAARSLSKRDMRVGSAAKAPPCVGPGPWSSKCHGSEGRLGLRGVSARREQFQLHNPRVAVDTHVYLRERITETGARGQQAVARGGSRVRAATWECLRHQLLPSGRGTQPPPRKIVGWNQRVSPRGSPRSAMPAGARTLAR